MPKLLRTLPERSVDVWVAVYLAQRMPKVALWAPTQRTKIDRDVAFEHDGKVLILEHKAPYTADQRRHMLDIDVAQLARYCWSPWAWATYYVLPSPPYPARFIPESELIPKEAWARTGQPPFQHWAYALPAPQVWDLLNDGGQHALGPLPPPNGPLSCKTRRLHCSKLDPASSLDSLPVPGQLTLEELVDGVMACTIPGVIHRSGSLKYPQPPEGSELEPPRPPEGNGFETDEHRELKFSPKANARVVQVPATHLDSF